MLKIGLLLAALGLGCSSVRAAEHLASTIAELSFMVGSWKGTLGEAQIEEHWIPAAGGTMLGVARTVAGEKTVAFEFLRIESRLDGIYYVAHPNARPGTDFKLTGISGQSAVFENPQHDHPKIIRYRKNPDGSLTAQVEGDEKGKHLVQEFHFRN